MDKKKGRLRLYNILENLVEKAKEEDFAVADVQKDLIVYDDYIEEGAKGLLSLQKSPEKKDARSKSGKSPRKKKKRITKQFSHEDYSSELNTDPNQHFMTLFDQKVDLSKFHEDSSLYSICREWVKSNREDPPTASDPSPSAQPIASSIKPLDTLTVAIDNNGYIYKLPSPLPKEDPEIPDSLSNNQKRANDIMEEIDKDFYMDELKASHIKRWKGIKRKCQESSHLNQKRYIASLKLLKTLFVPLEQDTT